MNQLDESTLQQLAQFENSEQLLWFSVWTTFERNNVWCRDWNGSDPRHVQGCQDGSTGLESQVPRQKCHPPVDTRPGVDMDPDGSGGKLNPFQLAILQPRQQPANC